MTELFSASAIGAFFQVLMIDISLAADNAVVIGLAAAGLPRSQRRRAIFWGIVAATVLRIAFASVAVQLLQIIGLLLAGGILLLWVCWKMWSELHPEGARAAFAAWRDARNGIQRQAEPAGIERNAAAIAVQPEKTLRQAIIQIIIADLSMSLDNVIAVAGAARDHPYILIFGLILSIGLMGAAAVSIARLLERHRWIAYIGLGIVFYVAVRMIVEGSEEVLHWVSVG